MLEFVAQCSSVRGQLSEMADFWRLDQHDVPQTGGAYVLVGDTWFVYPTGKSPVFYVGQSRNLRQRLRQHLMYSIHVREMAGHCTGLDMNTRVALGPDTPTCTHTAA